MEASGEPITLLRAEGLTRRAADGTPLLARVSLRLDAGARLALEGASGAGKSLLLRALALLDPLDGGRVEWLGEEPAGDGVPTYRRQVLYLAQRPMTVEGEVSSQLALPFAFRSARGESFDREAAVEMLRRAGRGEAFLRQAGTDLSGGEAQLVALVRALVMRPRVLLLDEPTSAMDADAREAAEALLGEWLAGDSRRAWIWVSHDPRQLRRTCRTRLRLVSGEVAP